MVDRKIGAKKDSSLMLNVAFVMLFYVYIWLSAQRRVSLTFIRLLLTFKGCGIPPPPLPPKSVSMKNSVV
jgi:hypothetical protein